MTNGGKKKKKTPDSVTKTYVLNVRVMYYRISSRHLSRNHSLVLATSWKHRTNQKRRTEKNNASNRKHNTEKRAIPWRDQEHNTNVTVQKKKPRKAKDAAKVKDNAQEPKQEQAPAKGRQKKQSKKIKTKDQGKDKDKKEQNQQANLHGKSLNQEGREKGKEAR